MKNLSIEEELRIIKRGVAELIPEEELVEKLKRKRARGEPLRIKYGADPSRPDLHLGHYVCLRKLKELQDLGHHIIFIVGDFTAMIGDPSGRSKTRPQLSKEEVEENSRTYFEQVFRVLDREKTEVRYNSEWHEKLTARDIIKLASTYTVARMLERDDFEKRFKQEVPISIHEFLYPIFQGYDSYVIASDIEVGGTDQKFNFLIAREIQKAFGQEPQVILTLPLLEGTDGKLKMSKSYDNYIGLTEPPGEIYGKVMSIPDELVPKYFELVLAYDEEKLEEIKSLMKVDPRNTKARLAFEIVEALHSREEAEKAQREFDRIFRERGIPEEIPEFEVPPGGIDIISIIFDAGLVKSKSEARRLVRQGGVKLDGTPITDEKAVLSLDSEKILKVGKRRFLKLVPSHKIR